MESTSVEEARRRHEQLKKEREKKEALRQAQKQLEREQKAEEERLRRAEHDQRMEEWRTERDYMLQSVKPAHKVFDYVYESIEEDAKVQQTLLHEIEKRGLTKFHMVETGPIPCCGFWFQYGLKEPNFTYAGKSINMKTDEYTDAFIQNASDFQRVVQRGPFKNWKLSIEYGGRLFGRLDPIGIFGQYVHVVLQQRRWYHWRW